MEALARAAETASPGTVGLVLIVMAGLLFWSGYWEFDNNWELIGLASMVVGLLFLVVGVKTVLTGEMW